MCKDKQCCKRFKQVQFKNHYGSFIPTMSCLNVPTFVVLQPGTEINLIGIVRHEDILVTSLTNGLLTRSLTFSGWFPQGKGSHPPKVRIFNIFFPFLNNEFNGALQDVQSLGYFSQPNPD